ncbi:MAG: tetratricopeptide repeat protein [Candidatus Omnitrophica bacterium]|nr:tetratricopeptide repeat protein [Candidatus Omnitrophota bacterium]
MKKNIARARALEAVVFGLILGCGSAPLLAAENTVGKSEERSSSQIVSPELAGGQNVEKLIYTLNETLQENRKIRQSMRDLQEAFEKVTLDKSDVVEQMKKVERLAIQRSKETGQRIDELNVQLENSKKEMEKLQASNKASVDQKLEVERNLEAINAENAKMQTLLKSSILAPERDQIVERMKSNEAAVQNAVAQISAMDGENVALKEQLIQSYFDLGNMFYDLGRFEDAAVQYLNVLKWNPYHAWAHHNLAVIYDFHLHKLPEARVHYQKYLYLKSPGEEAQEARMRLWDLTQLSKVTPTQPLKQEFDKYQKMPRS